MNDAPDQNPESNHAGSNSENDLQHSASNVSPAKEGLRHRRNAAEIAGETVTVVGASAGRFPRVDTDDDSGGESTGHSAFMVGAGILISRVIGVIRQRVFAHYLGTSDAAGRFH